MIELPRIAVGTVQSNASHHVMTWAFMEALQRTGLQVQSFFSQGQFVARDAAFSITGQSRRYLDSWLMPPDICLEMFHHGSQFADIAVVEGAFDAADGGGGGSLDTLCDWLDLPRLVIIDAAQLNLGLFPPIPAGTVGLLLDNCQDIDQLCRLQTGLEAIYGVPILGSLGRLECLRAIAAGLATDGAPTHDLCRALGDALAPRLQLDRILQLAMRQSSAKVDQRLFQLRPGLTSLHIAVAYDEAFTCYFPDTLDILESQGAAVSVFSPLRGERLPEGTDIVYFGCGRPEDYACQLADNFCIKEALWNHVLSGGRVYAESAGLAYLCREMVMPNGHCWPMVGVLPALARLNPNPEPGRPVEVTAKRDSWLFAADEKVRGYLNSKWVIHPDGSLVPLVSEVEHQHDLVGDHQIVGSRLHLHFAAHPRLVGKFFEPGRRAGLRPVA